MRVFELERGSVGRGKPFAVPYLAPRSFILTSAAAVSYVLQVFIRQAAFVNRRGGSLGGGAGSEMGLASHRFRRHACKD